MWELLELENNRMDFKWYTLYLYLYYIKAQLAAEMVYSPAYYEPQIFNSVVGISMLKQGRKNKKQNKVKYNCLLLFTNCVPGRTPTRNPASKLTAKLTC